jgi:peptidase M28-like protein
MSFTTQEKNSQWLPSGMGLLYPRLVRRIRRSGRRGDFTAIIHNVPGKPAAQLISRGLSQKAGDRASVVLNAPGEFAVVGPALRKFVPVVHQFARGDHAVFWRADVPALFITDTANFRYPDYHKSSDTAEKLDYTRLASIVDATASTVATIAERC